VYAWAVSTLSSTPEKRAACGAVVNIFGHIVSLIRSVVMLISIGKRDLALFL
jgi:hypothetical protein